MIRPCQLRLSGRGQEIVVFRDMMMKHASQIAFGRPERVVIPKPADGPDKWELLRLLTIVAEEFDLSHRSLGVLKALMTFLPTRAIPAGQGAIVFPSNRTLSDRMSGMPESTLRRHLAALVNAGVVSRHDSPNGKRYARRCGGAVALAYGFDLSPLAHLTGELQRAAATAQERAERLTLLRERVLAMRAQVIAVAGQGDLTDEVARLLRRKPDETALTEALHRLAKLCESPKEPARGTNSLSANDSRNERHIQDSDEYVSDSVAHPRPVRQSDEGQQAEKETALSLTRVTHICTGFQSYFPQRIKGWHDLVRLGDTLAPMIGVEQPVMHQAKRAMGPQVASVVVLCLLERLTKIRKPGAYLRHLIKLADDGRFCVLPMLRAVERAKLSADNRIMV